MCVRVWTEKEKEQGKKKSGSGKQLEKEWRWEAVRKSGEVGGICWCEWVGVLMEILYV